ncbi:hypothetical protein GGX14DRAFT_378060 [Mycena pura]|uniref:Uncharacterized protein n=1 Tax=Mycena pura TaxID=153505 RepID=A0AAD6UXR7_9AGAR|nr:hypothetical protein GGX14DRAFT_378060 [Mycena pura]
MSHSGQGYKRKRSLHDSPVDLTIVQQATSSLLSLKQELGGIYETTEEITEIMARVERLGGIIKTAKKPVRSYVVVHRRCLTSYNEPTAEARLNALLKVGNSRGSHIEQLCSRISRIYRHVSMRVSKNPSARMILDAVLLTVAEISSDGDAKRPVAIFPGMRIATGDGICLKNPTTGFEMWVTGAVDYGLCTYEQEDLRKGGVFAFFAFDLTDPLLPDRVLNGDMDVVRLLSKSMIFLSEGKRDQDETLYYFMPEAISQAAALCEVTGAKAVRFCLTDGRKWIFSVFSKDNAGNRVCYEGNSFPIPEFTSDVFNHEAAKECVRRVVELVYHWVRGTFSI